MNTATENLLSGYSGSKVHAVRVTLEQWTRGWETARSLCGKTVTVSDLPFKTTGLACQVCAKRSAA